MATQPLEQYSLEEYLKLQDKPESERSEFHDGQIFPVEASTLAHARLGNRVGSVLQRAFPSCAVYDSSLNLYISCANRIVHPDATVVCSISNCPKPNCIDNPAILVDITSPSTKDYDFGPKREHYFSLPDLQHYLLVSQSEMMVGHHRRSGDAWLYVDRHANGTVYLGDADINVSDIYHGISLN